MSYYDYIRWGGQNATLLLILLPLPQDGSTPIHRLPPELLSIIFILATHVPHRHKEIFDFPYRSWWRRYWRGTPVITSICQRWRAVALATPALWTYISGSPSSDQFNAYLHRSQSLPVSLFLDAREPGIEDFLARIAPRISRLNLAIATPPIEDLKPSLLSIDVPSVRCATLMYPNKLFPMRLNENSPNVQWVELFGRPESSLEGLALTLLTNWLPSNSFTHLTHLLLSCNKHTIATAHSGLLTLLGNTPRLEFLHIIHLWYNETPGTAGNQPVALNHLKSLVLEASVWRSLCHFFAELSLPRHTPITLLNTDLSSQGMPARRLDHPSSVTNLEIYTRDSQLQIIARSAMHEFLLQWGDGPEGWHDIAPELNKLLTLSAVTSVKLSLGSEQIILTPMFTHLVQVTHLEMYSPNTIYTTHTHEPEEKILTDIACGDLCHALSHFSLTIEGFFDADHPVVSSALNVVRKYDSTGTRLSSFVLQSAGFPGMSTDDEVSFWEMFAPHVDDVEVYNIPPPPIRPFGLRWMVEGAEKHWTLEDGAKPAFLGPCHWTPEGRAWSVPPRE